MNKIGIISIFLLILFIISNPVLSQSINNLNNITFTENSSSVIINPDLTITDGGSYGGGYILFDLKNGSVGDELSLASDTNPNAFGAISFFDGNIFLGNGSDKKIIVGSVDATLNGRNGNDLKINFAETFQSSSFENGLGKWTVGSKWVDLGTSIIAGFVSPEDNTVPLNSGGDNNKPKTYDKYFYELSAKQHTDSKKSLRLYSKMTTQKGCDVVHGPYVYSEVFQSYKNDLLSFDWRAFSGNDAYDVFGYILNVNTGATTVILDETGTTSGSTNWATKRIIVPEDGSYRFVFVSGTWNATCKQSAGASLYLDNIRVYSEKVNDALVSNIMRLITYRNACGTSSGKRDLEISVKNNINEAVSVNSSIELNTDKPVATCKNISVNLDANGQAKISGEEINNGSTDSCPLTFTLDQSIFTCENIGINQVTLPTTDTYGN